MSNVLILCYHALSESWESQLAVTPRELERQLNTLERRGFHGATFSDAVLDTPTTKTAVISFDDAYRSVLRLAAPILERHGFPGTVFAPTSFIGQEAPMRWPGIDQWAEGPHAHELVPMSWDELQHLAESGWEVGSHTRTHPRLHELNDDVLAAELEGSRQDCEERLGRPCRSLAYPYADHDARVAGWARRAGYEAACGVRPVGPSSHPHRRARIGVYRREGAWRFSLKTSAPLRWARRIRER